MSYAYLFKYIIIGDTGELKQRAENYAFQQVSGPFFVKIDHVKIITKICFLNLAPKIRQIEVIFENLFWFHQYDKFFYEKRKAMSHSIFSLKKLVKLQ